MELCFSKGISAKEMKQILSELELTNSTFCISNYYIPARQETVCTSKCEVGKRTRSWHSNGLLERYSRIIPYKIITFT